MLDKRTNKVLFDLLNDAFGLFELQTLTFSLFDPLYQNLSGTPFMKDQWLTQIVTYATKQGKIPNLLDYVKIENRYQYERHLPAISQNMQSQYQQLRNINEFDRVRNDVGPDINWQGSSEEVELQFSLRPEPDFQDVGFLLQAIERASSVCRVVVPSINSQGTGFLVAPDLVITNYHVIAPTREDDIDHHAPDVQLRFGDIRLVGNVARPMISLAVNNPVRKSSPPFELDYALVKLEDGTTRQMGIEPVPYSLALPYQGMAMNILQHPDGAPLQLALSGNGVDRVISEKGLVQYSTRALGGSSGAPCFNDDWEVVALHHAQRARSLYTIREGIIFRSIYEEIKEFLP